MDKRSHPELEVAALIAAILAVWGCFGLTRHAIMLMDAWRAAAPTQAVANLTAASAQWEASSKAQADSVTQIERDVRVEMWQFDRTLQTANSAIGTAQATLTTIQAQAAHVGPVLDAAKGTVEAARPVMRSLGASSDALTAAITANQQSVAAVLSQTVTLETTGNHMLTTADQVETKATHDYLHPSHNPFKRAWQASEPFLAAAAKITAAVF